MNIALAATFVCAIADWFAVARDAKRPEYIFKPATLLGVIALTVVILQTRHDAWQGQWFLVGFVFSLLGDIFLMLPNPRWFMFGLGAFLLAHVCYIVGLNPSAPPALALALLIPCGLVIGFFERRVIQSLRAAHHSSLTVPVIAYGLAMLLMVFSAWATLFRAEWNDTRRACVIVGATLFLVSDAMLAWNRFVKPFAAAKLAVIVTYHLGQIALALSLQT